MIIVRDFWLDGGFQQSIASWKISPPFAINSDIGKALHLGNKNVGKVINRSGPFHVRASLEGDACLLFREEARQENCLQQQGG